MTFDEMNTRIDQPMEHDIHRGRITSLEGVFQEKNVNIYDSIN